MLFLLLFLGYHRSYSNSVYSLLGIVRVNSFFLKYLYSRALFSRLSLFNFQGPSLPALADSLYILSHLFALVKYFFHFFQKYFFKSFSVTAALADSLIILLHTSPFVNTFFDIFFVFMFRIQRARFSVRVLYKLYNSIDIGHKKRGAISSPLISNLLFISFFYM